MEVASTGSWLPIPRLSLKVFALQNSSSLQPHKNNNSNQAELVEQVAKNNSPQGTDAEVLKNEERSFLHHTRNTQYWWETWLCPSFFSFFFFLFIFLFPFSFPSFLLFSPIPLLFLPIPIFFSLLLLFLTAYLLYPFPFSTESIDLLIWEQKVQNAFHRMRTGSSKHMAQDPVYSW